MTKKVYLKPELLAIRVHTVHMIATSVHTTGLGDDNLTQDNTSGNSWSDAMGRGHRSVWDDEDGWNDEDY